MAVPEGYTEVGLIGLVNKGNYDPLTEYSKYNFVYYQGSTYLYINELPQSGVTPSDDGVTWQYMSRGMIMDNTPTQGSQNAVTSGGIYDSERALKTEIQNEQTAATTKATDTNNVLGQGTVTNATNVQALLDNVTDKDTNPTKDSAKTVTSGGVYSADKATREMIAPVEENATSSAPYAIGEQLIFNGVLCEATSAISIGDTLAMGTNLSTANKITNRDSTPTANSTKLVTSGGVYSADNQIRENIANVEGATSAHPYTVGKQLIFNGLLCKVTSAIAVGDTLAVGTNLTLSDNVVEQIYSLNQGLTNSLANISHENLLDNPWFTVNQRGQSSYLTTAQYQYTLDRWFCYYADTQVTINSDGSIILGEGPSSSRWEYLRQYFELNLSEKLYGKTITVSAIDGNGKLWQATGTVPTTVPSSNITVAMVRVEDTSNVEVGEIACGLSSNGVLYFDIISETGHTITIKAVKLELGTVSTLAMDTVPNYATELLKCQRYFIRLKNVTSTFGALAIGIIHATNHAWLVAPLPTTMRATPTITMTKATESAIVIQAKGDTSAQAKAINSVAGVFLSNNMLKFNAFFDSQTDYEVGAVALLWISDSTNSSSIDLSADL